MYDCNREESLAWTELSFAFCRGAMESYRENEGVGRGPSGEISRVREVKKVTRYTLYLIVPAASVSWLLFKLGF